ncbi:type ISP restriction/modification enzyme [Candidatus Contendibacter odensensis]|uniref:type ISP restriction/modification enzyme n=1 Tax=Candidatus Contendibacter odensensis TaxID=1400860 RepID=UPI0004B1E0CD|nr:type ISP restriction/modification enzyme [Candidatus Contendobacter odensis]
MSHPLETYLATLCQIYDTGGGGAETSYYGALENLLNQAGDRLKPQVRAVPQLRNTGAGAPDFGLFSASQFENECEGEPLPGQKPERGVVEVKGWREDAATVAASEQVARYVQHYGVALVSTYRDFILVGRDAADQPMLLEHFQLAASEAEFLELLRQPRQTAARFGDRLLDFLARALSYNAPLTDPQDLAWFLASHAREARARVDSAGDLPGLIALREGLERALGLKFEGETGERFFRATLVQTLFYGVFSAWVLWARQGETGRFDWRAAAWSLHVPMIASLFEQIATPKRLQPLHLDEVLDWAGRTLNRVVREAFFQHFEEEYAVQYFYEPFLKAYDPALRKQLGVWYTPPDIVRYQVARVDAVLREELHLTDGLADPSVLVLDPCCGTGAYLVEVLRRIQQTLQDKSGDALTAAQLKQAALTRIFGFELLPAPFVVAHLQLGLLLRKFGVPLREDRERVGIYLTNALTNWEPLAQPGQQMAIPFPEFQEERDKADEIKQRKTILVILGNPPYNAFAGISPEQEGDLVEAYKENLNKPVADGGWGIKKFNLDDLYVRFFRIAERRIVKTGRGVVCYISNHSWVGDPSFVALRQHLLNSFDKIWVENLHGNRKVNEYAPDGRTSDSIFTIPGFSEGIRQSVVTSLWVRTGRAKAKSAKRTAIVRFRDDIDAARAGERRAQLLASLDAPDFDGQYQRAQPNRENRFSFRPMTISAAYQSWPSVLDLCAEPPSNGLMEKRGGGLIDIDRDTLEQRMRAYFDPALEWAELAALNGGLTKDAARFDARKTRTKLLATEQFDPERLRRYAVRAFDTRWCYYLPVRPLWNEPRPRYWQQCWDGNAFFMTRFRSSASPEGAPCSWVAGLSDDHFLMPDNACFPVWLRHLPQAVKKNGSNGALAGIGDEPVTIANLSPTARAYLQHLKLPDPDQDAETAALIWRHALAIGFSPAYQRENSDGIRQDWPRIPLPDHGETLQASVDRGRQIAALLDVDQPVVGVTAGKIQPELRPLGLMCRVGGGALDPDAGELAVTAGWGYAGKDGATMPGKGRLESRPASEASAEPAYDLYLNPAAYVSNVPRSVWEYSIGGYQVIKKWLSYREKALLGRDLRLDEAQALTGLIHRLAALTALQPQLDTLYAVARDSAWKAGEKR